MNMGTGEVVPFERASVPAVREDYTQAIQLWCQTRDIADALTREEIGAMDMRSRLDAQRKAIILSLAHYYREHDRADVAPGVAVVLTLLSDNEKGSATISQETLATLFGRSRTAIFQAQSRLKELNIIKTSRGRYAATYPVIPRAVTGGYNHLTWLISAICTPEASFNCKDPQGNCQLERQPYQLDQLEGPAAQLKVVNCKDDDVSIAKAALPLLLSKTSKEETTLECARDARSLSKALAIGIAAAAGSLPLAAAPMEPPAIVQPASQEISYDELKAKLMEAGGEAIGISAGLEVLAVPRRWLLAGCDLNEDILPAIRARSAKMPPRSINSWNYFEQAVADSKSTRLAPMPEGRAPPGKPQQRLAPWEEEQVRLKLEADAVSEKLRAKYKREMEEQGRG